MWIPKSTVQLGIEVKHKRPDCMKHGMERQKGQKAETVAEIHTVKLLSQHEFGTFLTVSPENKMSDSLLFFYDNNPAEALFHKQFPNAGVLVNGYG